jgi:hypothetical protein
MEPLAIRWVTWHMSSVLDPLILLEGTTCSFEERKIAEKEAPPEFWCESRPSDGPAYKEGGSRNEAQV